MPWCVRRSNIELEKRRFVNGGCIFQESGRARTVAVLGRWIHDGEGSSEMMHATFPPSFVTPVAILPLYEYVVGAEKIRQR